MNHNLNNVNNHETNNNIVRSPSLNSPQNRNENIQLKHLNTSSKKQIPWQKRYLLPLIKYSLKIFLLFFVAAAASRAEHEPEQIKTVNFEDPIYKKYLHKLRHGH